MAALGRDTSLRGAMNGPPVHGRKAQQTCQQKTHTLTTLTHPHTYTHACTIRRKSRSAQRSDVQMCKRGYRPGQFTRVPRRVWWASRGRPRRPAPLMRARAP